MWCCAITKLFGMLTSNVHVVKRISWNITAVRGYWHEIMMTNITSGTFLFTHLNRFFLFVLIEVFDESFERKSLSRWMKLERCNSFVTFNEWTFLIVMNFVGNRRVFLDCFSQQLIKKKILSTSSSEALWRTSISPIPPKQRWKKGSHLPLEVSEIFSQKKIQPRLHNYIKE
jgi:hypothetical protein